MTTTLLDAQYCSGTTLRMKLGLRFTNTGNRPLVLYTGSTIIVADRISRSEADARSQKYEVTDSLSWSWDSSAYEHKLDVAALDKNFATLAPGASYETTATHILPINLKAASGPRAPGVHVLQVTVQTWPDYLENDPAQLAARWKEHAEFWWRNVTSEPMKFIIESKPGFTDCRMFSDLLEAGRFNPNALVKGFSALMAAVAEDDEELFRSLLERGADVNAKTANGYTATTIAATYGNDEFLKELIDRGADISARADDGRTALFEAIDNCRAECVRILVQAGADLNLRDAKGRTPLEMAKERCHDDHDGVVKLLTKQEPK